MRQSNDCGFVVAFTFPVALASNHVGPSTFHKYSQGRALFWEFRYPYDRPIEHLHTLTENEAAYDFAVPERMGHLDACALQIILHRLLVRHYSFLTYTTCIQTRPTLFQLAF